MKLSMMGESAAIYLNLVERKGAGGRVSQFLIRMCVEAGRGPPHKTGQRGRELFRREDDTRATD